MRYTIQLLQSYWIMNNMSSPPLMEFRAPLNLYVTQPVLMNASDQLTHLTVVSPLVLHLKLFCFFCQPLREESGRTGEEYSMLEHV